ncbi:TPA: fibrinogen-binding adhesin SdrG C-terminal domain-containing protein [Staphylococcus pseudintermedius]|nr:fibrinogen-binding adhesin SdrG C-terminal domain-containing protein [Staphylococcus pseudintermedius]
MITNKNIYSIRKHKLGVASFLLGTLFIMGQAHDADASEISETQQEQNVDEKQAPTAEAKSTSNAPQQEVASPAPVAKETEEMKETDSAAAPNTQEVKETKETEVATSTETKDSDTTKARQDAQPLSSVEKPATQTAPVEQPTTSADQTLPRQAQEGTTTVDAKVINVETGKDVTSKVKVEKSSITAHQNNSNNKTSHRQPNDVNPHNAERVTLDYEWSFENGIKEGDYFDFQLSDNVDTNGISATKKVPHIMDNQSGERVIAYGEIDSNNRVRYRFTNYVNEKQNLNGKLSLNLYINPVKVQNEGETTVSSTLGEKLTSQNFNIKYVDGVKNETGVTLNGHLDYLLKADQSFTHYATFKPNKNKLTNVKLTGTVTKGAKQNGKAGEVKVYEYIGQENLPKSGYTNVSLTSQFKDITKDVQLKYNNGTGYEITFNNMNENPYVIVYKGHYMNDVPDFDFITTATGNQNLNQSQDYLYLGYNNYFNLKWENGVVFYSNNATGEGKDKPVPPTFGFSPTVNTIQDTHANYGEMTFQATGSLEEIEDSAVLITFAESGEDRGENTTPVIETTEDTQPVEFEETTTFPPSNHAHEMIEFEEDTNQGIQDVTLHADAIDFEEETNHGEQDTVHHSDAIEWEEHTDQGETVTLHSAPLVEYDEETTTGMVTGAMSDHTTVEDTMEYTTDHLLIEFEDEMNPNMRGQYGDIAVDTIEESSQVDTFTELESEFGQHDGAMTFEEDTIVQKPKTEKGHRVPRSIDLTTPKNNQTFNIQPITPNTNATATYQIGDFVWRDEDHNGVQNDGERGLEGVFVTLKTPEGKILRITTTDETGHYRFTNVEKGKYVVEFKTPEGYEATSKHTTADTSKDSDGLIANINVTQDDMTIDAGFFPLENWNPKQEETYTIGDFVWRDEDHNGVQNDGERGLEGVLVTLKTPEGTVVASTTSDANGHYHFTNVQKGKYVVEFTTPEGYEATSKHTTANTAKDSDGLIANIDVTQDDMTIDAGFFPLENWNPQPEPKQPEEKEMPEPKQPEPMNPDEKEKPEPKQPDTPQPEPMNPGENEMPEPNHPDIPQPEPMNPGENEKPEPKQPDTPQHPGMNEQTEPTMMPEHQPMKEAQNETTPSPKSSSQTNEALPETGESTSQPSALLFGGLLSLFGLALLRRPSKQKRSQLK